MSLLIDCLMVTARAKNFRGGILPEVYFPKGRVPFKKCHKKWKKSKGGEGSILKIKKSTIKNVDFLIRGGGEARFSGFYQM